MICHNDFAPYNWVFSGDVPIAVIDFDLCGPGPRLRDLAYLAYWLAPLSFGGDLTGLAERDLGRGCPRLGLICDTYGLDDREPLLDMVSEVLRHMGDANAARAMVGDAATQRLIAGGHLRHWQREATAFERHKKSIVACI